MKRPCLSPNAPYRLPLPRPVTDDRSSTDVAAYPRDQNSSRAAATTSLSSNLRGRGIPPAYAVMDRTVRISSAASRAPRSAPRAGTPNRLAVVRIGRKEAVAVTVGALLVIA